MWCQLDLFYAGWCLCACVFRMEWSYSHRLEEIVSFIEFYIVIRKKIEVYKTFKSLFLYCLHQEFKRKTFNQSKNTLQNLSTSNIRRALMTTSQLYCRGHCGSSEASEVEGYPTVAKTGMAGGRHDGWGWRWGSGARRQSASWWGSEHWCHAWLVGRGPHTRLPLQLIWSHAETILGDEEGNVQRVFHLKVGKVFNSLLFLYLACMKIIIYRC